MEFLRSRRESEIVTNQTNTFENQPMHVLVVDDDPVIRVAHVAMLQHAKYQVTGVADGEAALRVIEERDIELVLLESKVPGISGLEVVKYLRKSGSTIPVILVAGLSDANDRIAGLEHGADDYLTKPIAPRELLARIRALVRGRKAAVDSQISSSQVDLDLRTTIADVIDRRAFHPVFQSIVSLPGRNVLAYEALTRFEDGCRPDIRFREAARVGLGDELALATLAASIRLANQLPYGRGVHVNVAPDLLRNEGLVSLLATAGRPLVVELTEHDPIDDYDKVNELLDGLGHNIRLAIDDAGAGFASMSHILALRPHIVKLDREWVKGVDVDLPRQALIRGLVSFARATGTTLVAEGVEFESEATMLAELGIEQAQGFLFDSPRSAQEVRKAAAAQSAKKTSDAAKEGAPGQTARLIETFSNGCDAASHALDGVATELERARLDGFAHSKAPLLAQVMLLIDFIDSASEHDPEHLVKAEDLVKGVRLRLAAMSDIDLAHDVDALSDPHLKFQK